jgi:hypothetical protein
MPMPRDNDQDGTPQGVFGAELRYYPLRSEALPRMASRDLIMKVAEDRWT